MHITRSLTWERLSSIGWDGFCTFVLSLAVVTMSGGLTLLACWVVVLRFARLPATGSADSDVILVMGARLNRHALTPEFRSRLGAAARYGANRPVIVMGGMAKGDGPTEAALGRQWLTENGLDAESVLIEDRSRNSLENLSFARDMMRRHKFQRPLLVTSRHHLARSAILAGGLGMSPKYLPASDPSMWHPSALWRSLFEALMINWYYVGRFVARATRHDGMLSRVT